jgi:hypothetical protein
MCYFGGFFSASYEWGQVIMTDDGIISVS